MGGACLAGDLTRKVAAGPKFDQDLEPQDAHHRDNKSKGEHQHHEELFPSVHIQLGHHWNGKGDYDKIEHHIDCC